MKVIRSEKLSTKWEPRFVIVDDNGNVLDDAQGYGYTSAQNAHRAWGWKHNKKARAKDRGIAKWWRKHKDFEERLTDLIEDNFKEIGTGFVTDKDIFAAAQTIASEMGVDHFTRECFDWYTKKGKIKSPAPCGSGDIVSY